MNRTARAFERRFRELLATLGARDREKAVRWLFSRAELEQRQAGVSGSHALAELNIRLTRSVNRYVRRKDHWIPQPVPPLFCDAGLGGLARWLRAAGCDAHWVQDIPDHELVERAALLGACIITTDSFLLDRRPIIEGLVRALWVPPSLTRFEQLRLVRAELDLPETESRCMRCGGELVQVEKEAAKSRIPPRTYLWVDEYFECSRCGQLFWHGTHWAQITARLAERGSFVTEPEISRQSPNA